MEASRDDLVEHGVTPASMWTDARAAAATWREQPGASIWYSIPLVEAVRPG
jgi:hypothetical protein